MPSAPVVERGVPAAVVATAKVTVTVGCDQSIVCSPDPVDVQAGQTAIEFRLATPGYVFRQHDAIVVSDPGGDFPRPSVTSGNGKVATLRDRNLGRHEYKYSVYVQEKSTGRVISVDPTIRNDPV